MVVALKGTCANIAAVEKTAQATSVKILFIKIG
jgi:hypothetical protein